jgi:hypothetical protein
MSPLEIPPLPESTILLAEVGSTALDAQLEAMASDEAVPERPDRERIESWTVATHLRVWRG